MERWFLDVVATALYPVDILGSSEIEEALNRPGHGLPLSEVPAVLDDLHRRGLILFKFFQGAVVETGVDAKMIATALEAQSRTPHDRLYWGMTAFGGECWERLAAPDWSRFLDASYSVDPKEAWVCGVNRDAVRRRGEGVLGRVLGTERWIHLEPWHATYWKTLPSGCELRFDYVGDMDDFGGDDATWFRPVSE